jgi:hypothetical protein
LTPPHQPSITTASDPNRARPGEITTKSPPFTNKSWLLDKQAINQLVAASKPPTIASYFSSGHPANELPLPGISSRRAITTKPPEPAI